MSKQAYYLLLTTYYLLLTTCLVVLGCDIAVLHREQHVVRVDVHPQLRGVGVRLPLPQDAVVALGQLDLQGGAGWLGMRWRGASKVGRLGEGWEEEG